MSISIPNHSSSTSRWSLYLGLDIPKAIETNLGNHISFQSGTAQTYNRFYKLDRFLKNYKFAVPPMSIHSSLEENQVCFLVRTFSTEQTISKIGFLRANRSEELTELTAKLEMLFSEAIGSSECFVCGNSTEFPSLSSILDDLGKKYTNLTINKSILDFQSRVKCYINQHITDEHDSAVEYIPVSMVINRIGFDNEQKPFANLTIKEGESVTGSTGFNRMLEIRILDRK